MKHVRDLKDLAKAQIFRQFGFFVVTLLTITGTRQPFVSTIRQLK
jgi:hypothetical protein